MEKIENNQKIKEIIMYPETFTICEIGGDFYKNNLEIKFIPDKYYPDYMKVQEWIIKNIDGKKLNIEDVVDSIYNYLIEHYTPKNLKIIDRVTYCKTHFDVTVIK